MPYTWTGIESTLEAESYQITGANFIPSLLNFKT